MSEPDEKRLADYFIRRAIECLEAAKREDDPLRKRELEVTMAHYWRIAKTGRQG